MAALTGTTPAATYTSLIKFNDNLPISAALRVLSDGGGTDTPIFVSTSQVNIGGTGTIDAKLGIKGLGTTSSTTGLRVQNSSGTDNLIVTDSGNTYIGSSADSGFKLDVNGTARVQGQTTIDKGICFPFSATPSGQLLIKNTSVGTLCLDMGSSNFASVYIQSRLSTSATPATLLINNGGGMVNIGIGGLSIGTNTSAPSNGQLIQGSLGIGTITVVSSAKVQIDATTQGFLPPRMTTAEKNAITTPSAGLIVYDTTLNKLCVRGASAWETITSV